MKTSIGRYTLCCAVVVALLSGVSATPAMAGSQYTFDPQLSLTGGCTTDEVDPVVDPSCPYEAFPAGPSGAFKEPGGMAVDPYGDLYVVVAGPPGRIDIFGPEGGFISELQPVGPAHPDGKLELKTVAVDSKGNLYVYADYAEPYSESTLLRFEPTTYLPEEGKITYEAIPTPLPTLRGAYYSLLAINSQNNHVFVDHGFPAKEVVGGEDVFLRGAVVEYGSAEEGNPVLDNEVAEEVRHGPAAGGFVIDAARGRLYASEKPNTPATSPQLIRVFELAAPHNLIETLDGASFPDGTFVKCGFQPESCSRNMSLAVDEGTGDLFVYDFERQNVIYEMTSEGQYLTSIKGNLSSKHTIDKQVLVDNGEHSPNGAQRSEGRYLWATADPNGVGHAFAFRPREECPPVVESTSFAHVGESEALLQAEVEPCHAETFYRFEYVSAQRFAESHFETATLAGEGTIAAEGKPVRVSAGATGLVAGGRYVFRVVAENALGKDEGQGSFRTYPAVELSGSCPNQSLRTGPSALLPDCRAYELVTPPDTGGLPPAGMGAKGALFLADTSSPDGGAVSFRVEGGILPGTEGTGSLSGDPYRSTRGADGWSTVDIGGKGSEFFAAEPGGRSPDQAFSIWRGVLNGHGTNYLRFPDGHSEPLGRGSLGTDPDASPLWISPGGTDAIFSSTVPLEEGLPGGQAAIYDRTADGVTHVVSLLPEGQIPTDGATFAGASQDGRGIAFTIGHELYLRYGNEQTYLIGENLTFEGVAEGGKRVFYLDQGKLCAFDFEVGTIHFTSAGEATVVNVSRDGSSAYFVSTSKLTAAPNPLNQSAEAGQQNLYLSREGKISFVATLTERDVVGAPGGGLTFDRDGLGFWATYIAGAGAIGALPGDPSRTSRDGGVLLFSSRAPLTSYDNAGQPELYRYDSNPGELQCISCDPTGLPGTSDADLQFFLNTPQYSLTWRSDRIENLTSDGSRAFFETNAPLVAADVDGLRDVYEWEAEGVGSCAELGGCVYLISSGNSSQDDFLYGVSEDGDNVFIASNDLLDPAHDPTETRSVYDARVGGGFAVASSPSECLGEACQPAARPPERPAQLLQGAGNVQAPKGRCRKGKRRARKHGKTRCVKHRHRPRRRHHRKHHPRVRHGAGGSR